MQFVCLLSSKLVRCAAVRMLSGFKTAFGVPRNDVDLQHLAAKGVSWSPGDSSILSEAASLSMEFSCVAKVTSSSVLNCASLLW